MNRTYLAMFTIFVLLVAGMASWQFWRTHGNVGELPHSRSISNEVEQSLRDNGSMIGHRSISADSVQSIESVVDTLAHENPRGLDETAYRNAVQLTLGFIFNQRSIGIHDVNADAFLDLLDNAGNEDGAAMRAYEMADACRLFMDYSPALQAGDYVPIEFDSLVSHCERIVYHSSLSLELLQIAASEGNDQATIYMTRRPPAEAFSGHPRDRMIATREWQNNTLESLIELSEQGNAEAMFHIGRITMIGTHGLRDESLASRFFSAFLETGEGTDDQRAFAADAIRRLDRTED